MYSVGDKIVYPMHGAGVIEAIEVKKVLKEKQTYYIMKMPVGGMILMIPTNNTEEIGIRGIVDKETAADVVESFGTAVGEFNENWNKRYRENLSKIKTGNIVEVAKVVKSLAHREMDKPLSTCEKKMLTNARHILVSELVLATDDSEEGVEKEYDAVLKQLQKEVNACVRGEED